MVRSNFTTLLGEGMIFTKFGYMSRLGITNPHYLYHGITNSSEPVIYTSKQSDIAFLNGVPGIREQSPSP